MAKTNAPFVVFNGGEIGPETLDRITLENYGATSEVAENLWLDANGPMGLRPGFGFMSDLGSQYHRIHSFSRSVDERFVLCFQDSYLRVADKTGSIIARPTVGCSITNGSFASSLTGWVDSSTGAASATWASGRLLLNSNGSDLAILGQAVNTSSAGTLHAIDIYVHHGPVVFMVGSSLGGTDLIEERTLRTGHHSLAFTPEVSTFYIRLQSSAYRQIEIEAVQIAPVGDMYLDTPWAEPDLQNLRFDQSLNVMYVSSGDYKHRRLERWDNNSWSLSETNEEDGPFRDPNTDESLTITPSVRVGNGSLSSSRSLFKTSHVGALFRLTQSGQFQSTTITGADQWSDPILVQGVGGSRAVTFTVSSGLSATVRLQRSIGDTSSWANASTSSSTSGAVTIVTTGSGAAQAFNDGLDNNLVYYRVGVASGGYTSGSSTVTIYYAFGSNEGIVRITNYASPTSVSMEVLSTLSLATATYMWEEGAWSDYRGWPRATAVFDGRLWTLKDDRFWGSYSDAYESHEYDEGDSSAIARAVAVGAANKGQWIMPLGRLIIGTEGAEVVVRSNAFDEPLSTTNMTVREMSTYGVGNVQPIKVDTRCLYSDASGFHLMEIVYNVQLQDYVARPLTTLHREIGRPGLKQLAVMRRPDTRVLVVRSDGELLTKLFDPTENVMGWSRFTSTAASGKIESVCVIPGDAINQDELYISIRRVINGVTKRYLERLGPVYYAGAVNARCLDSYLEYSGTPVTTITGLSHLNGEEVMAWADGYYAGTYTVSGGQITLATAASVVVVGLYYAGRYKSAKLTFGAERGTALNQRGRSDKISLILRKAIRGGIEYGQDFDTMHRLQDRSTGDTYDSGPALVSETTDPLTMPGRISKDPRVCLRFNAPYPGWINGMVIGEAINERVT